MPTVASLDPNTGKSATKIVVDAVRVVSISQMGPVTAIARGAPLTPSRQFPRGRQGFTSALWVVGRTFSGLCFCGAAGEGGKLLGKKKKLWDLGQGWSVFQDFQSIRSFLLDGIRMGVCPARLELAPVEPHPERSATRNTKRKNLLGFR